MRDLSLLAVHAMADPTIRDRHLWIIEAAVEAARAERYVELLDAATVFRAVVVSVVRVKRTETVPGKARIELAGEDGGDREEIETDWLTPGSVAMTIATRAKAWQGCAVEVWKHNEPDPGGRVTQGFRRIVWIRRLDTSRNAS